MPETLAGLAWVGGDAVTAAGGARRRLPAVGAGVGDDGRGRRGRPPAGRREAAAVDRTAEGRRRGRRREAAWELGWLRDGRAVPPLAAALAARRRRPGPRPGRRAGAADLLADVPLGRAERVDARLPGRVSLAAAYPPAADVSPLPAARLALPAGPRGGPAGAAGQRAAEAGGGGQGEDGGGPERPRATGAAADAVRAAGRRTAAGRRRGGVRAGRAGRDSRRRRADAAELKAACEQMLGEIPALAKRSAWEQMRWRARVLAGWSRRGARGRDRGAGRHGPAGRPDPVVPASTSIGNWPAPAATGRPRGWGRSSRPRAGSGTRSSAGWRRAGGATGCSAFTRPHLGEQTVCYVTDPPGRPRGARRPAARWPARRRRPTATATRSTSRSTASASSAGRGPWPCCAEKLNEDEPHSRTLAFRAAKALGAGRDGRRAGGAAGRRRQPRTASAATPRSCSSAAIGGPEAAAKLTRCSTRRPTASSAPPRPTRSSRSARAARSPPPARFRKADDGAAAAGLRPAEPAVRRRLPGQRVGGPEGPHPRLRRVRRDGLELRRGQPPVLPLRRVQRVHQRADRVRPGHRAVRPAPAERGDGRLGRPPPAARLLRRADAGTRTGRWRGSARPSAAATPTSPSPSTTTRAAGGRCAGTASASYDLATDRFRPAAYREAPYGEPANAVRLRLEERAAVPGQVLARSPTRSRSGRWTRGRPTRAAGSAGVEGPQGGRRLPADRPATRCAAVDQDAGPAGAVRPAVGRHAEPPQTWAYDPAEQRAGRTCEPAVQPRGVAGRRVRLRPVPEGAAAPERQEGDAVRRRRTTRSPGPTTSATNPWTDLQAKNGPGNPWVGAMDFDPEHNVFVLFNHGTRTVWAYRHWRR